MTNDVDETHGVNKSITIQLQKADIEGHHLNGTIPGDLMSRNNLVLEAVPDGNGDMKLNTRPDGTIPAFINFEDSF